MNYRLPQTVANVVITVPLLKKNGEQASGLVLTTIAAKIIGPNGAAVTGFTPPTITEPGGDGVYVLVFPTTALVKAFVTADAQNPYVVSVDSSDAGVEPSTVNVMIVPTDYLNNFMRRVDTMNVVRTIDGGYANKVKVPLRDYQGNPIAGIDCASEMRMRIIGEWDTTVHEYSPSGTPVDGEAVPGAAGWYFIRTLNDGLPDVGGGVLNEEVFPCWVRVEITPVVAGRFVPVHMDIENHLFGSGKPVVPGILKVTTAERLALTPDEGDMVYDTNLHKFFWWDGSSWNEL